MCNYSNYNRKTRKRRDVCTFSYYFSEQRLGYNLSIPLNIPDILELLTAPVTLGDHLRRRRLELGLHQKDVAKIIGVTTSSVWNWEHGADRSCANSRKSSPSSASIPASVPTI
jgi:DNA-binding XRE family transcriptional regulator